MGVHALGIDDRRVQLLDQLPAFLERHVLDAPGMIAKEQAFAPGLGMGADDRVIHRRPRLLLLLGHQVFAMPAGAREIENVNRAQQRQTSFMPSSSAS